MNISTIATSKAMNLIAKEFKDCIGACAIIGINGDTVVAKVNSVVYEICTGSIVELERTRSSLIRKVNKWIRENISTVYNVKPVEKVEAQEAQKCNCLEKIGTIYKNRELRDLQHKFIKLSCGAYGITLLGIPVTKDRLYLDQLDLAKKKANSWAHPDKGGDGEAFDMITTVYNRLRSIIDKHGYI